MRQPRHSMGPFPGEPGGPGNAIRAFSGGAPPHTPLVSRPLLSSSGDSPALGSDLPPHRAGDERFLNNTRTPGSHPHWPPSSSADVGYELLITGVAVGFLLGMLVVAVLWGLSAL